MPSQLDERPAANSGIFPARDQLPLGRPYGLVDTVPEPPSTARPFGLSLAVAPRQVGQVNPADLGYDEDAQMGVIRDGGRMVPIARHSTGTTNTQTNNDGHQGRDSDTDATED